eukprot:1151656-Lingulodinium_polyedra.AAC.1
MLRNKPWQHWPQVAQRGDPRAGCCCLVAVWLLFGGCLVAVWWLFGGCLVIAWRLLECCLAAV